MFQSEKEEEESMTNIHNQEKSGMQTDFQQRIDALIADFELKIKNLGQQKDDEREQLRGEMQLRIDELLN